MMVRPKKFLGQHFLKDLNVAHKIVESFVFEDAKNTVVVEIGPGMGVLTRLLLAKKDLDLYLIEIDYESVDYLKMEFPEMSDRIISGDFLKIDWWSGIPEIGRASCRERVCLAV